jgi:hypothetical protein
MSRIIFGIYWRESGPPFFILPTSAGRFVKYLRDLTLYIYFFYLYRSERKKKENDWLWTWLSCCAGWKFGRFLDRDFTSAVFYNSKQQQRGEDFLSFFLLQLEEEKKFNLMRTNWKISLSFGQQVKKRGEGGLGRLPTLQTLDFFSLFFSSSSCSDSFGTTWIKPENRKRNWKFEWLEILFFFFF